MTVTRMKTKKTMKIKMQAILVRMTKMVMRTVMMLTDDKEESRKKRRTLRE